MADETTKSAPKPADPAPAESDEAEPANKPEPEEPSSPAKEWGAAVVLMALFALAFFALISMFRP
jgi:hypothetical protein